MADKKEKLRKLKLELLKRELAKRSGNKEEMSAGDVAIGAAREAAAGATFGASPFLEAAMRTLKGPESFSEELEGIRGERKEFQKEYPVGSAVADIGGGLVTGGGAAKALKGAGVVAQRAVPAIAGGVEGALREYAESGDLSESAKSALIGAGLGAVIPSLKKRTILSGAAGAGTGAILSEEGEESEGAVKGALAGVAISKAAPRAKKILNKFVDIQNIANRLAAKAVGVSKDMAKRPGQVEKFGRSLLETGTVKAGKSRQKILEDITGKINLPKDKDLLRTIDIYDYEMPVFKAAHRESEGSLINKLSRSVDELVEEGEGAFKEATGGSVEISLMEIADRVKQEAFGDATLLTGTSLKEAQKMAKHIDDFIGGKPEIITLKDLNTFKRALSRKVTNEFSAIDPSKKPIKKQAFIGLYRGIKRTIKDTLNDISEKTDLGQMLGDNIDEINDLNRLMISGSSELEDTLARESRQGVQSLLGFKTAVPGVLGTIGGVASGNPTTAVVSAILGFGVPEAIRRYGNQTIADALSSVTVQRSTKSVITNAGVITAKLLMSGAPEIARQLEHVLKKDPDGVSKMIPTLIEQIPDLFVPSAFASEFDGKLHNPIDKRIYLNNLDKDDSLSNSEKMRRAHIMNKSGELPQESKPEAPSQALESVIRSMGQ